jgi:hypothetical protein
MLFSSRKWRTRSHGFTSARSSHPQNDQSLPKSKNPHCRVRTMHRWFGHDALQLSASRVAALVWRVAKRPHSLLNYAAPRPSSAILTTYRPTWVKVRSTSQRSARACPIRTMTPPSLPCTRSHKTCRKAKRSQRRPQAAQPPP